MKTLLKLLIVFFVFFGVKEVKSEILVDPLLNVTEIRMCLGEVDTVKVLNDNKFKHFLWQIYTGEQWVAANDFDTLLFPIDTLAKLAVPGSLTLDNLKLRCKAIDHSNDTSLSAEVPITVDSPVGGTGVIHGQEFCCFGPQDDMMYSVSGYTNADQYNWLIPSWATKTYSSPNGDMIKIAGYAPDIGGDTVIKVIPVGAICGQGNDTSIRLRIIPKILGNGSIEGLPQLCAGNPATYTASGFQNATQYHWTVPSWATVISGLNDSVLVIVADQSGLSGELFVEPVNPCDTGEMVQASVSVYDQLIPGTLKPDMTICYKTSPGVLGFATLPSGSNGEFIYQWQDSTATNPHWTNINLANSTVYSPGILSDDHFYRVKVAEDVCGAIRYTEPLTVTVFPAVVAGMIGESQTICENAQPDTLQLVIPPSGGTSNFSYQWISTSNHIQWENVGEETDFYLPPQLSVDRYYQLIVTSSGGCGSDTTNEVLMEVKPLPLSVSIQGNISVCRNQSDAEYLADPLRDYTYTWSMLNDLGTFETGQNTYHTYIHWGNISGTETLMLRQITDTAHCESITSITVTVLDEAAPEKSQIIRKSNTNILVCSDTSDNIKYQWGFIPKSTGIPEIITDGTLQYVILPHDFDTSSTGYNYFVDTYFEYSGNLTCTTRSYMNKIDLPIGTEDPIPSGTLTVFPDPCNGILHLKVPEIYSGKDLQLDLLDIWGRECFHLKAIPADLPVISIPPALMNGMYILRLKTSNTAISSTRFVLVR